MKNFREFYENRGVDYDAFLQRMMGKEPLIEKYIGIFMADSTYAELELAMAAQDLDTIAFKAHSLKGIAQNLNFEKLGTLCMNLISSVRSGDTSDLNQLFEQLKDEYVCIIKELGI